MKVLRLRTVTSLDESPTTSQPVVSGGEGGISPALASFIAQTVQAALAAERSAHSSPPVSTTPPQSTAVEVPNSSVPVSMASLCFGGVPSSLGSSASNFLAAGTGLSQQGRSAFSLDTVVPSFVSTFANPLMSASVSSSSVYSLQNSATHNVADRSAMLASPLFDQLFIVCPGFSPVPAKLVIQIVAGKYIDLSDLLAVNLVQREPEPQLLFDGRLVLTSQPKKQWRCIEDIASWMEAFTIFSLILVSHFPNCWKDLMQYQLLILRTYHHFSGRVWLILLPRDHAPFGQHQESRPLAQTSGQVQHRKSTIHGLPVILRMFRVKFDKSDWFWSQSIVFTKPFKNGMPLDQARGRNSWC